jgi:glycosyltransferase involved in cell wall biosynthesis
MAYKTKHKLALVIPYYKIDFFEETIKSIASQTNKNFNIYIGNDASPDDPLPIIQKYFAPDTYRYFDYKTNLGGRNLALQWERILDNVQEEWFQILGDDDMISENFVDAFYNTLPLLEEKKITAVKFRYDWIDNHNNHMETFDYKTEFLDSIYFFMQKYLGSVRSSLSENIFKTEMYYKHHFEKIPLAWGSDDIALLTFSGYKKIWYVRNTKVSVRISDTSISGTKKMNRQKRVAYNLFREKIITKHAGYFPSHFMTCVIEDYLSFCHYNCEKANYRVLLFYLSQLNIIQFLKKIRKIYHINKMYQAKMFSSVHQDITEE